MNTPTWKAAEPPELPETSKMQDVRGYARVGSIIALTIVLFIVFMSGRFLKRILGGWVTYHYLVALVWAKIHGFPWWPSQVRSTRQLHDAEPKLRVLFLFTNQPAWYAALFDALDGARLQESLASGDVPLF